MLGIHLAFSLPRDAPGALVPEFGSEEGLRSRRAWWAVAPGASWCPRRHADPRSLPFRESSAGPGPSPEVLMGPRPGPHVCGACGPVGGQRGTGQWWGRELRRVTCHILIPGPETGLIERSSFAEVITGLKIKRWSWILQVGPQSNDWRPRERTGTLEMEGRPDTPGDGHVKPEAEAKGQPRAKGPRGPVGAGRGREEPLWELRRGAALQLPGLLASGTGRE